MKLSSLRAGQKSIAKSRRASARSTGPFKRVPETATAGTHTGDAETTEERAVPQLLKTAAETTVKAILSGSSTEYEIVSRDDYNAMHGTLRSSVYEHYEVLCMKNTRACVGWLVCTQIRANCCSVSTGVRKFSPKTGTTSLLNHVKIHQENRAISSDVQLSLTEKRRVIDSAVDAVVHGLLPLSFAYKKPGIVSLARVLIEIGQSLPANAVVDVVDLLPSNQAVLDGVTRSATKLRRELSNTSLPRICKIGGGITCDGLKQPITGRKYYDLVLHYVEFKKHLVTGKLDVTLHSRVLLLNEHSGPESAENIRANLNTALVEKFNISFDRLMKRFTLVTDWAATMPCIVGASASSNRVPFGSKWVGCVVHQLNTILKNVMDEQIKKKSTIATDLENVKELVRIFKSGSWNSDLPDGCSLIPECETRFGTIFDVVTRFLKAAPFVTAVVSTKNHEGAKIAVGSLETAVDPSRNVTYPALQAIVDAFAGVRHMQNAMEAASYPVMHYVLPMWKSLVSNLSIMSSEVARGLQFQVAHEHTRNLAKCVLVKLKSMEVHGAWVATCLLHPGLRTFSYISPDDSERNRFRDNACSFVRTLMSQLEQPVSAPSTTAVPLVPTELGAGAFNINDYISYGDVSSDQDELARYLATPTPQHVLEAIGNDKLEIFRFWYRLSDVYPRLSKVALRLFATPPSSCASERDFSIVNRIVTPQRNRLNSTTIEDLILLRAFTDAHSDVYGEVLEI